MRRPSILITGITGFIGSHIAEMLVKNNVQVIGLKRRSSDTWRCAAFADKINWVDTAMDDPGKIIAWQPAVIIHCAWDGAGADKRDDAATQQDNIVFLKKILALGTALKIKKFIGLGSQAEYGMLKKAAGENDPAQPISEYGKAKLAASREVSLVCEAQGISWYWLRLFSFYGPKESSAWFIPYVITSLLKNNKEIKLSRCNQRYAYLYITDLCRYIIKLADKQQVQSGIYNISGPRAVELKKLVIAIKKRIRDSRVTLQFGTIPMRKNQPPLLRGLMKKYHKNVGEITLTDFDTGIRETIKYYEANINESI